MAERERVICIGDASTPLTTNTYSLRLRCTNCDWAGVISIPKGLAAAEAKCPHCECSKLTDRPPPENARATTEASQRTPYWSPYIHGPRVRATDPRPPDAASPSPIGARVGRSIMERYRAFNPERPDYADANSYTMARPSLDPASPVHGDLSIDRDGNVQVTDHRGQTRVVPTITGNPQPTPDRDRVVLTEAMHQRAHAEVDTAIVNGLIPSIDRESAVRQRLADMTREMELQQPAADSQAVQAALAVDAISAQTAMAMLAPGLPPNTAILGENVRVEIPRAPTQEEAADAINAFTRSRVREDGFFRRISIPRFTAPNDTPVQAVNGVDPPATGSVQITGGTLTGVPGRAEITMSLANTNAGVHANGDDLTIGRLRQDIMDLREQLALANRERVLLRSDLDDARRQLRSINAMLIGTNVSPAAAAIMHQPDANALRALQQAVPPTPTHFSEAVRFMQNNGSVVMGVQYPSPRMSQSDLLRGLGAELAAGWPADATF